MVKPLNKEWALFGRKYRVAGAKGEKVDCHACQKQVSAAVNRLQSHLRVCPARPLHVPAEPIPPAPAATPSPDALGDSAVVALDVLSPTEAAADANALAVGSKRPRTATLPTAPSQRLRVTGDAAGEAYAKRRLEIDEQRLQLECERAQREQKREAYELAILAAQARTAQLAAEKQAYETRVLLALSRKQLRDQGVGEEEIDRVLPIEPLSMAMAVPEAETAADAGNDADADANGHAEAAAANAAALEAAAAVASEGQVL